jgi:outer membrane immunogenic protein
VNYIRIAALVGAAIVASTAAFAQEGVRIPARFNRSGFYAGVNAGGAWYDGGSIVTSSNVAAIIPPSNIVHIPTSSSDSAGFTAGGLTGFNYQIGTIVIGAETDFTYIDLKSQRLGSSTVTVDTAAGTTVILPPTSVIPVTPVAPAAPGTTFILFCPCVETLSAANYSKVDWYGTVRARLGLVPFDRLLLYGTGGLAYGKVETSKLESSVFSGGIANRLWQGNSSEIKWGWTVGAGAEYALTPQVAVRMEYLYVDLGQSSVVATFQGTDPVQSQIYYTASRDNKFSVARAAISTKF